MKSSAPVETAPPDNAGVSVPQLLLAWLTFLLGVNKLFQLACSLLRLL
jgi:hypothetical protein